MLSKQAKARGRAAFGLIVLIAMISCISTKTQAALVISDKATHNVTCAQGTCRATDKKAVLNATDLANLLSGADVTVLADKSPKDIEIFAHFSWASAHMLTLDAYESIEVRKTVTVREASGLTLVFNDGSVLGNLVFAANGRVEFENTKSSLVVNSKSYKLLKNIHQLSKAVVENPSGNFALVKNYDAAVDGTYTTAPVATPFSGSFEGLGNRISNLSIDVSTDFANVGLFAQIAASGVVRDIVLSGGSVQSEGKQANTGSLAGLNAGTVDGGHSTANVSSDNAQGLGGLVGTINNGLITNSSAGGDVEGVNPTFSGGLLGFSLGGRVVNSRAAGSVITNGEWAGGLVGDGFLAIYWSYATGNVSGGDNAFVGGLIGDSEPGGSTFFNCYATGAVSGGNSAYVGGLAGVSSAPISYSYSLGHVSGGSGSHVGGSIGGVFGVGYSDIYWDTETSGTDQATGSGPCCGITGLTTAQFKSGLPAGFDAQVWRERAPINDGFPYLLDLPPSN